MFENIPAELRALNCWVLWRYTRVEEKLTKVPYSLDGTKASVTDPTTWSSFDAVISIFDAGSYSGIGFVFNNDNAYAGIDIDYHNDDPYRQKVGLRVIDAFVSYTEYSPSGRGLHIIVKGTIEGARRHGVEAYSTERFFTMTGNVFRDLPIIECQDMLDILQGDLRPARQLLALLNTSQQSESDEAVIASMLRAKNGAKIAALVNGDGNVLTGSDKSGSAIDQAIVNNIQFFTKNIDQIDRIWCSTPHAVSRAKKMKRAAYRYMTIQQSFDREVPLLDVSALLVKKEPAADESTPAKVREETSKNDAAMSDRPPNSSLAHPQSNVNSIFTPRVVGNPYVFPPGLMGEIARYIHGAAARPVIEISLAAAIGLMAGIAGKGWNVSSTGLNLYILLLANTGRGKDAISEGINGLIGHVTAGGNLAASKFIGPSNINSGQALAKFLGETDNRSFVSIIGEFGIALKSMCSIYANSAQDRLQRELLDLYNKSGKGSVVGSNIYADKKDSTQAIKAPAVSLIGESTQVTLYKSLDEAMISSGLLPRFLIIDYNGPRVPKNEARSLVPTRGLVDSVSGLIFQAATNINKDTVINVRLDGQAQAAANAFSKLCDYHINVRSEQHTSVAWELWNRAEMKALRLAALVAVGVNMHEPVIDITAWNWAYNIVVTDILNMLSKFSSGEVAGGVAQKQWEALRDAIIYYSKLSPERLAKYRSTPEILARGMIPYSFLMVKLSSHTAFKEDKGQFKTVFKNILDMAVESGLLAKTFSASTAIWYQISDVSLLHRE